MAERRPNREVLRREGRRRMHPAVETFLYGKRREEPPVTATPEGYDGTHADGIYVAGHHTRDEEER